MYIPVQGGIGMWSFAAARLDRPFVTSASGNCLQIGTGAAMLKQGVFFAILMLLD